MSLFDSAIKRTIRHKLFSTYYANQTDVVLAADAVRVDCGDYNTLVIEAIPAIGDASTLSINLHSDNQYFSSEDVLKVKGSVKTIISPQNISLINTGDFNTSNLSEVLYVDIAGVNKFSIAKGGTGTIIVKYKLLQTSKARTMIDRYNNTSSIKSSVDTMNTEVKSTINTSVGTMNTDLKAKFDTLTAKFPDEATGVFFNAQNPAVTDVTDVGNLRVNCEKFNTLLIQCLSSNASAVLKFVGYTDNSSTFYWTGQKVMNITNHGASLIETNTFTVETVTSRVFLIDVSDYKEFSFVKTESDSTITMRYRLDVSDRASNLYNILKSNSVATGNGTSISATNTKLDTLNSLVTSINDSVSLLTGGSLSHAKLLKFLASSKVDLFQWKESDTTSKYQLAAVHENIAIWHSNKASGTKKIFISLTGITGTSEEIAFDSTNFPGLITGSSIERVCITPFTRNMTSNYTLGREWRMNVITSLGQIYHNFPARAVGSDGSALSDDYKLFDESVIWELPERWTPVKTESGSDATLIATGKYRYFPALPDVAYEFHPAISTDNGYSNGGFPATITKTKTSGEDVTLGRFWQPLRSDNQDCSFSYMGGYEAREKMTIMGTYRSNRSKGTRICTFATNDGGRNWYCIYEFGASSEILDVNDNSLAYVWTNYGSQLSFTATAVGSGVFQVKKRSQYVPSADDKEVEKTKKFKYGSAINVSSITGGSTIVVVTETNHGLTNGDIVVFDKVGVNAAWDWLTCTGYSATSAGDGVIFKAKITNSTTFELMAEVHNPHNNLPTRHIHSINQTKDGFVIGTGEAYPEGWILYFNMIASDSYDLHAPYDNHNIIRLNSTSLSVQRPLGVIMNSDSNNTIYVGVDNERTDLGNAVMPTGRTDTFKRGSQGVYKGTLVDFDSQGNFECILESKEVCYLFKKIAGAMIYIGQQMGVAISLDDGQTWIEGKLPTDFNVEEFYHFGGVTLNREIIVDNLIIKLK